MANETEMGTATLPMGTAALPSGTGTGVAANPYSLLAKPGFTGPKRKRGYMFLGWGWGGFICGDGLH